MKASGPIEALREWAHRAWGTFRGYPTEQELKRELDHHLEMAEEALRRQGYSAREAARLARLRYDTVPQALNALHEQRGLLWLGRFSLDVKLGARRLRKSWGLTAIAGLAMTIAIAIAAGGFSFVRALSGGPVPLDEGDRIVAIQTWDEVQRGAAGTTSQDFRRWRDELRSVDDVGAFRTASRSLALGADAPISDAERNAASIVSVAEMGAAGFRLARVPPLHGRPLVEADERADAEPVVVIGYDAWRARFAADPQVVGRRVRLDGTVHTVVGVMPQGFLFPINHQYWVPLRAQSPGRAWEEGPRIFTFGRLAPDATLESAQAELTALGLAARAAPSSASAASDRLYPRIRPYAQAFLSLEDGWAGLIVLLFTLLLVPPCANIAILVYARTVVRQEEFAVRAALGANRGRIVAQLFLEMLLLSAAAACAALLFVHFVLTRVQIGISHSPGPSPFWMDLGVSVGSALYVGGLALLAGAIAGVVPALQATGTQLQSGLRALSGGGVRPLGKLWSAMIVAQVALAMTILPLAANVGWGFLRPVMIGPGFAPEQYVTARVQFFGPAGRFAETQPELVRRVEAEPGIAAVAVSQNAPGAEPSRQAVVLERPEATAAGGAPAASFTVTANRVAHGFFDVFGVPLLAGRTFEAGDFEPGRNPVLINRTFAEHIASEQGGPLGQRIRDRFARTQEPEVWHEIVGIVADFPANDEARRIYFPMAPGQTQPLTLTFRVEQGTEPLGPALRDIAAALDSALVIDEVQPLDVLYLQEGAQRMSTVSALAVVTLSVLLLSAAGMYALMSFTVNQRRREIGIRAALGAQPRRLLVGTFRKPMGQIAMGAAVGLLGAYAVGVVVPIEDLGGRDVPGVLVMAAALMIVVAVSAVAGPARRALRLAPTEALREGG